VAKQEHKQKNTSGQTTTQADKQAEAARQDSIAPKDQQKLTDDIDGILGEIDEVLEVNAEDFIRDYVQSGGQ